MIKYFEAFISGLALGMTGMLTLSLFGEKDVFWFWLPMIFGAVLAEKTKSGWIFVLAAAFVFKKLYFSVAVFLGGAIDVLCGGVTCGKRFFGDKMVFALLGFFAAAILYVCL